jgi:hypothetical protein
VLDAIFFEKRGIPASVIITEPFVPTAVGIAELAGMPGYPYAVIPHPVGSLSTAEVHLRADAAAAAVEALLLGTGQRAIGS